MSCRLAVFAWHFFARPSLAAADAHDVTSVVCQPRGLVGSCRVVEGRAPGAAAYGSFVDGIEGTGWGRLSITSPHAHETVAGYAAGLLEGHLTATRVVQMYTNYRAANAAQVQNLDVQAFVRRSHAWGQQQAAAADEGDAYWGAVRLVHSQLDGLVEGVQSRGFDNFTLLDALLLNAQGDISDIEQAVNTSAREALDFMGEDEFKAWKLKGSHCSAIVKFLPDGSELFTGHNMWWGYYSMLFVWKHYSFPRALGGSMASISMPSYPGILASNDDFYQSSASLVVMETTNSVYDNNIFDGVHADSLLYWLRVMAANYLAASGPAWMELFARHNSGTYNNMWMVVDYNLFQPFHDLRPGTLTVGEQLPNYFHSEDQTHVLSYGYWPSYNKAFYPETQRLSGQTRTEERRGELYGYQLDSRAQVFRRDQATVVDEAGMRRLLRYNDYQNDLLAGGDPCTLLACRDDLTAGTPVAFGSTNAKFVSAAGVRQGVANAVAGPTHDDDLPIFDWRDARSEVRAASHVGQPDRFDFDWQAMGPFAAAAAAVGDADSALVVVFE